MTTKAYEIRTGGRAPLAGPAGWTDAHSEAAWFLGECFAVGALCGVAVELARPLRGRRHG